MVHGASQNFEDIFLTAGSLTQTPMTSLPVYLASNGVDVWGIDLGWTRVPQQVTDFSFMENWDVNRDTNHTLKAMSFARLVRVLTGGNVSKLNLLGFSYGAYVAFDAAGDESQEFFVKRDVKGIIPTDQSFKYAPEDEEFRQNACAAQANFDALIANGQFANPQGLGIATLGALAVNDPNSPSPVPDFQPLNLTNLGVAIFTGANSYFSGGSAAPFWHFVGGNGAAPFDIATDLQFTTPERWARLYADLPPYMPQRLFADVTACQCNEDDVSIDDFIAQIQVPVFYYGAGGGSGTLGIYSNSLVGSSDVSSFVVTLDAQRFRDFGHADLFTAQNASQVAWPPLLQWLENH
jgi:pimeloyl-ACP methyl ester carboxylesterase